MFTCVHTTSVILMVHMRRRMVSMRRHNPLVMALTLAAMASGCGDASLSETSRTSEMPPTSYPASPSCLARETMALRLPSPRSLKAIATSADLVAEIEITGRYEVPGEQSFDEVVTRRMASAVVKTNLSGAQQDQQLVIFVSVVSRTPEGKVISVLGARQDEQLVTGTRLLAGLMNGRADEYELSGSEILIGDNGQLSVLGFEACPTAEEKALTQEISGRSISDVVVDLQVEIARPPLPDIGSNSTAVSTASS